MSTTATHSAQCRTAARIGDRCLPVGRTCCKVESFAPAPASAQLCGDCLNDVCPDCLSRILTAQCASEASTSTAADLRRMIPADHRSPGEKPRRRVVLAPALFAWADDPTADTHSPITARRSDTLHDTVRRHRDRLTARAWALARTAARHPCHAVQPPPARRDTRALIAAPRPPSPHRVSLRASPLHR